MTPVDVYEKLMRCGVEWVDLDEQACLLEETQKTLLSQLMLESINRGSSVARAEAEAKASPAYQEHIDGMVAARAAANRAKVKLDAARAWFDAWRTQESTKRAEMHMAGAA